MNHARTGLTLQNNHHSKIEKSTTTSMATNSNSTLTQQ
jgi:hypothetical protein